MAGRTYIAIDLKSFYASVECVERGLDPLTANLVVADESRTDKTICLAVSPSLKAYGIPGRARLFEVKQKLKEVRQRTGREVEFLTAVPRMARYIQVSADIYQIYLGFVSEADIHIYSIDEVFMDVTDYLPLYQTTAHDLARTMIRAVLEKTGITATAGIGPNLYLAKIAMDIGAKHVKADADGVRIAELDEAAYKRLLWGHRPLRDFWRIGPGIARRLEERGIFTMGDLARASLTREEELYRVFGVDAEILIDHAWGIEPCTMKEIHAYKPASSSVGMGQVLQSPYPFDKGRLIAMEMADALALDLTDKGLVTDAVHLEIGYDRTSVDDGSWKGKVREDYYGRRVPAGAKGTFRLSSFTSSGRKIREAVLSIYDRETDPALFVRRLTLTALHVMPEEEAVFQLDLFTDQAAEDREKKLQQTMLEVRRRFGANALVRGMNLKEGATGMDRNRQIGGHKA